MKVVIERKEVISVSDLSAW